MRLPRGVGLSLLYAQCQVSYVLGSVYCSVVVWCMLYYCLLLYGRVICRYFEVLHIVRKLLTVGVTVTALHSCLCVLPPLWYRIAVWRLWLLEKALFVPSGVHKPCSAASAQCKRVALVFVRCMQVYAVQQRRKPPRGPVAAAIAGAALRQAPHRPAGRLPGPHNY
jgi:hypothetical protein